MPRSLLGIALVLLAAVVAAGAELPQAPPPRRIPIEEWVKQLGSKDAAEREAATKRLSELALEPPPELLAATKSKSADLRERASKVAQAMRWNLVDVRMPRGERFADQGRADLFVAATEVWDLKADDLRLWEPAVDLGRRLIAKAEMTGDRKPLDCPSSSPNFAAYVKPHVPPIHANGRDVPARPDPQNANPPVLFIREAIQAPGVVDPEGICNNLIVSRGSVQTEKAIQASVVFATGDVTARNGLYYDVIVCDGDVTLTDSHIHHSVIVARGNISSAGGADSSVLMAGGKVTLGEKRLTTGKRFNVIKENEANPLGITFFELSTVGVEVKAADKDVSVSAVAEGKAFAKAGVKVGDVIAEVNGKKLDSAESLRRLLRDALAIGDATLTLKRNDKTETVKVSLPE